MEVVLPAAKRAKVGSPGSEQAPQDCGWITALDKGVRSILASLNTVSSMVSEVADWFPEATKEKTALLNVCFEICSIRKEAGVVREALSDATRLSGSAPPKTMCDAATDTVLTPSWWDSDRTIEAERASGERLARNPTHPTRQHAPAETEDETAMDTEAAGTWANVVRRNRRKKKTTAPEPCLPPPRAPTGPASVVKKPPAILIKPSDGRSFDDTVRSVRACGLTAQELGASVSMRKTRDGSLLLELPKGAKSASTAKSIAEALGSKLGDSVGKVSQIGVQVQVEVLDLDAVSTAADVLEALRAAIPGENDPAAAAEREAICDVRIWPVRSGQQVATAKMSRYAAAKISRIPVGWTLSQPSTSADIQITADISETAVRTASGKKFCPPDVPPSTSRRPRPDPEDPVPLAPPGAEIGKAQGHGASDPQLKRVIIGEMDQDGSISDYDYEMRAEEPEDSPRSSPTSEYLRDLSAELKRKSAEAAPVKNPGTSELEAGLQHMRSSLKSAIHEARMSLTRNETPGMARIIALLEGATTTIGSLLSKKGKLLVPSPPLSPSQKKARNEDPQQVPPKPVMVDASTDTLLTPSWWDSDRVVEARAASKRRLARKSADATQQLARSGETEDDTAVDTDAGGTWAEVARRRRGRRKTAAAVASAPAARVPTKPASVAKKPPAILVKPSEGKSFADTVRAVRSCGFNAKDVCASVSMRETRDGSLLLELPKGAKSSAAAKTIAEALGTKLGDSVGRVSQLGVQVEIEVLDLDAVSSAAEVLQALRASVPGGDDPTAVAEREAICDVRIWPVRGGQQVATAKMSRYAASVITEVPVGWTICRVRPRTRSPERCFRCQAFGHNARSCTAQDRSGACWRCGETGHPMKDCKAGEDSCLACEMAGLKRTAHKPGSGACAARRQAAVSLQRND
ncbi:hypothetical protein QTP88_009963 [Uroleucon formosanum]